METSKKNIYTGNFMFLKAQIQSCEDDHRQDALYPLQSKLLKQSVGMWFTCKVTEKNEPIG